MPVSLDYERKVVTFHPATVISDDIPSELTRIKSIYADVCAKNPQAV